VSNQTLSPDAAARLAAAKLLAQLAVDFFNSVSEGQEGQWSAYERFSADESETRHDPLTTLKPICSRLQRMLELCRGYPSDTCWERVQQLVQEGIQTLRPWDEGEQPAKLKRRTEALA
jgi:hypothetical protein